MRICSTVFKNILVHNNKEWYKSMIVDDFERSLESNKGSSGLHEN